MSAKPTNTRPAFDKVIADIADYVERYTVKSDLAFETAHYCLIDSLGCGFEALSYPACTKLLGPIVAGTVVPHGARVPGTPFVLDPVHAAFNIGALVRWLDYNDAFYGETVIHPSDTISGILATADWLSRTRVARGQRPLVMRDVLEATVKAYEIMGCLALENGFTARGLDHTILVKIAVTADSRENARRHSPGNHERAVERVGRRPRARDLPPQAQHRLAQIVGGGRRGEPRGAARADGAER